MRSSTKLILMCLLACIVLVSCSSTNPNLGPIKKGPKPWKGQAIRQTPFELESGSSWGHYPMNDFSHLQLNYSHLPNDYDQQFKIRLFVVSDLRTGHSMLDMIKYRKDGPWTIEFANAKQDGLKREVAYTNFSKAKTNTNTFSVTLDFIEKRGSNYVYDISVNGEKLRFDLFSRIQIFDIRPINTSMRVNLVEYH